MSSGISSAHGKRLVGLGAVVLLASLGLASVANAGECENLSYRRNAVYKNAGYCFKTAAQIRIFGNAGCQFDNMNDVPLSARQRAEVDSIVREERAIGCR